MANRPGGSSEPAPRQRPTPLPLVGRGEELQALLAAYAQARSGVGAQISLVGPPGCGARRLIREFLKELGRRQLPVTVRATAGRSRDDVPFGALVPLLADSPTSLADLLRGMQDLPPNVRAAAVGDGLARALRGPHPLLVVIGDADLLDKSSQQALAVAAHALADRVLVLVHTEVAWPAATALELGPLTPAQAQELASLAAASHGLTAAAAAARAEAAIALSGRLPGLVVRLARSADPARPAGERLAALTPSGPAMVAAAWLADGRLVAAELTESVGAAPDELDVLTRAGAVTWPADRAGPTPASHDWWDVAVSALGRHRLQGLAGGLSSHPQFAAWPASVRATVLAAAGDQGQWQAWLQAAHEAGPNVEARAKYLALSHECAPLPARTESAAATADAAVAVGDYEHGLAVISQTLPHLPAADVARRCELLVVAHRARFALADPQADSDLDEALQLAARCPPGPATSDAYRLDALRWVSRDPDRARLRAEQALAAGEGDRSRTAGALEVMALATGIRATDRQTADEALGLFDEALEHVGDDRAAEGRIAANRIYLLWRWGRMLELRRAAGDQLQRLAAWGMLDSVGGQVQVAHAVALQSVGQWDELQVQLQREVAGLSAEVQVLLTLIAAELAGDRGEFQRSAQLLAQAAANPAATGPEVTFEHLAVRMGLVALAGNGSWGVRRDLLAEAADLLPRLGDDTLARARVRVSAHRMLAAAGEPAPAWLLAAGQAGAVRPGQAQVTALLAEEAAWAGSAEPALGCLEERRLELWAVAAAAWAELPDPYRQSWCELAQVPLVAIEDGQAARELAAKVAECAHRLGAAPLAERAAAEARKLRVRAGRGAGPLTARELDVVRAVARGRTNREAARELGLSERTVAVHLSRVFAKLGAGTRGEVAHLAREQGLI